MGEEPRTFTHRVRIFGMWLKLVTRMRLMLLLLRVLWRQREKGDGQQGGGLRGTKMLTEVGEGTMGPQQGPRITSHGAVGGAAGDKWIDLPEVRESVIPFFRWVLPPPAASCTLTNPPGAVIPLPEILLCAECFATAALMLTPTTLVAYYCPRLREKETDIHHLARAHTTLQGRHYLGATDEEAELQRSQVAFSGTQSRYALEMGFEPSVILLQTPCTALVHTASIGCHVDRLFWLLVSLGGQG